MTFDYQNLSAPDLNKINGSSSALGEGTFKRREELRRAESVQRNRVRMSERLDRNITRSVRKGDARSAEAFNSLKQSITGQGYMGGGGIVNAEDQKDRVKDGAVKAADIRYNMGNIGNTNPADGPIANAPPPVEKPQGGGPAWDADNSGVPDSIQRPVAGPQTAPEAAPAPSASPSATPAPKDLKSRQAFAADLDRSSLIKSGDSDATAKAYQRGEQLGLDTDQVDLYIRGGKKDTGIARRQEEAKGKYDAEFGASDAKINSAIANLGPGYSPEQIAQIRKNMANLTPQQRKDSVKDGEASAKSKAEEAAQKGYEASDGESGGNLPRGEELQSRVNKLDRNINESLSRGNKTSAAYDQVEKERVATRDAGFISSEEKLKSEFDKADKGYIVARKQSQDYFSDLEKNSNYNASMGLFKRSFMDSRADPAPPEILNYDTFDPEAPNMGQKKPLYQSVYGGPEDTYKSLGVDKDSKGNRNLVVRENESYYGPTHGLKFSKDAKGNRNIELAGLKEGKNRGVIGSVREYKAAIEKYFKPSSNLLPR